MEVRRTKHCLYTAIVPNTWRHVIRQSTHEPL